MIKYIGIALLTLSLTVYGGYLSAALAKKSRIRGDILLLIAFMEKNISDTDMTLSEIYRRYIPTALSEDTADALRARGLSAALPYIRDAYESNIYATLADFAVNIGRAPTSLAAVKLCRELQNTLRDAERSATEKEKLKKQIYPRLGWISGAVLLLLFL